MKAKGIKKQSSKLINCILRAPAIVLRKAREFYAENLTGCTGGGVFGARRDFSAERRRGEAEEGDDMAVLLRAAFPEMDVNRSLLVRKKGSRGVDRSYSDRVGRIGRIDENEPCDFMEVDESSSYGCRSYSNLMKHLGL
nr:hypothetical protein F511_32403 [Ipomoea trifida]